MKKLKYMLMTLLMILPMCCTVAFAAGEVGFHADLDPAQAVIGEEVTMIVSLDEYTEESDQIRGLQIDIENVDPNILDVVSYESLIIDDTAVSNTGSHHTDKHLVRLFFAKMQGTLASPCEEVFKVKFRIIPELKGSGEITLPITMKIQTLSGQRIVLNKEHTIRYDLPQETTSVDISWGALNYTYNEGTWNPDTHRYEGEGWDDHESGFVTVRNNGDSSIRSEFIYESLFSEISGSFKNDADAVDAPIMIDPDTESKIYLELQGKPGRPLQHEQIGTVTVRIGGD